MIDQDDSVRSRRAMLKNGLVLAGALVVPSAVSAARRLSNRDLQPMTQPPIPRVAQRTVAATVTSPRVVRPDLMRKAMAALNRAGSHGVRRDRMAIVDFAAPSSQPRLHLIDLASGQSASLLVAHGSGSDPSHTGWLQRFSNENGSNASSQGAFLTADYYVGKHGRSQRLIGLDSTNCNALDRAIVVHSAWYANRDMIATRGMLGRSQGCFAVGEGDLDRVFARLGPNRLIYAAKAA